jgi:hypothetical protein
MGLATFAWCHATTPLGAIGLRLFGVEGPLRAGEALTDDFCVFVYEDCHISRVPFDFRKAEGDV